MRVAVVQAGLSAGGTERVVSLLVADRCMRGDEVHLFAFVDEDELSYFPLATGVVVHRLVEDGRSGLMRSGFFRGLRRVAILRAEFRRLGPDLVVSFLTKINLLCLLAAIGLDIPVVVSERNNPKVQKKHYLWRLVSLAILGRADCLVMQTKAILQTLPASLRKKAVVIGNPCDRAETLEPAAPGPPLIVAAGRLVEQKGFDALIDAFHQIAAQFPDWLLIIHGEGPDREALQQKISAMKLADRIRLAGVTERAGAWVSGASLFVSSSRYEGFPNVLIEAMAAGLPVVSTRCDFGPSEIVETGVSGLLVPVDDIAALSSAMSSLMADDSLRRNMAKAGQDSMARFSSEGIMAKWDACFRQVTQNRGAMVPSLAGRRSS